jgi:tetratricopeptide (TPR) repeat protein
MPDWDGKYVVVEDALAAKQPATWVVSAVAESLQAARALLNVETEPTRAPKVAFSGEEIGRTLILRRALDTVTPGQATIYRLTAAARGDVDPQPKPPVIEPDVILEHLLDKAGVATSDSGAYAQLNMYGFLGSAAFSAGDFATAEPHFRDALALAVQIGHPASIVKAYGSLGALKTRTGQVAEALKLMEEALAIARENHLSEEEGVTLANLAEAHAAAGNADRAIALHIERRELAKRSHNRPAFALSTANVGISYFETARYDEAITFLNVAVSEFRALGATQEMGRALAYLGVAYQAQGNFARAIETYNLHIDLCRQVGDFTSGGGTYANLSGILYGMGRRDEAVSLAAEGLEQLQRSGSPDAARLKECLAAWRTAGS